MTDKIVKLLTSSFEDDIVLGINLLLNDQKISWDFKNMPRGATVYTLPEGLKFQLYLKFIFYGHMFKTIDNFILKSNFFSEHRYSIYIYGKDD